MDYQNKRGGRVQLRSMVGPQADFDHPEKVWEGCEGLNLEGPKWLRGNLNHEMTAR